MRKFAFILAKVQFVSLIPRRCSRFIVHHIFFLLNPRSNIAMSPHPSITTPPQPLLPRQAFNSKDPYEISSLYAQLYSLYPELYSSYSYDPNEYTSLMDYYSSLLRSYSITDYVIPTTTGSRTGSGRVPTTARATARATATGSRATSTTVAALDGGENTSNGGLSTGAKIGIGVGVALGVLLLAGIGICLWCMGKRKGKKSSTTIVAPAQHAIPQVHQQPPQMNYVESAAPPTNYVDSSMYKHPYQAPQPTVSPPPQYVQPQQFQQPQQPQQQQQGLYIGSTGGAYGGGHVKGPDSNIAELEHEYHYAKPGVVEMGDGLPEREPTPNQGGKLAKKKQRQK